MMESLYECLKAVKTELYPDILTAIMGKNMRPKGIICPLPKPRAVSTVLLYDDYNDTQKIWYDTTFGISYHGSALLNTYGGGGVAMIADETLLSNIDLSTTDFTIYLVDVYRSPNPAYTNFLVGGDGTSWDWRFGMSDSMSVIGNAFGISSIYGNKWGNPRTVRIPYVDVIRYNHSTGAFSTYNIGMNDLYPSSKPTNWSVKISCNSNTSEAYGFYEYRVWSYLLFAAAAKVYHTNEEVAENVAWLKEKYSIS